MTPTVQLTGGIALTAGRLRLDESMLGGRRARLAFAVLVLARHRDVSEHELAEVIWPRELPASWRSGVRTAVAQIRAFLGQVGDDVVGVVNVRGGSYRLRLPEGSTVDVEEQRRQLAVAEALMTERRASDAAATARSVASGAAVPFLADVESEWAEDIRRGRHAVRVRALEVAADAALQSGQAKHAVAAAEELIRVEPYHDLGQALLIRAHLANGNRGLALRIYRQYRDLLASELGVAPSPAVQYAYAEAVAAKQTTAAPGASTTDAATSPARAVLARWQGQRLVGRVDEMALLRRWAGEVTGGRGARLVVIEGAAGVGKTHLAAAAAAELSATGTIAWFEACTEDFQPPYGPLQPWVDRAVAHIDGGHRTELFDAVAELMAQDTEAGAVFVIDDLHHAPPGSLDLLQHLFVQRSAVPLLVLATAREGAPGSAWAERMSDTRGEPYARVLRLGDLDPIEAMALFEMLVQHPVLVTSPDLKVSVARRLGELTAGNPLLVCALATHRTFVEHLLWGVPMASQQPSVTDIVANHLAQLDPVARGVLEVAAVAGPTFERQLVHAVVVGGDRDEPEVDNALRRAAALGLLRPGEVTSGAFVFAHELVRLGVTEAISADRRASIHLAIGRALEVIDEPADVDRLAYHFAMAWPACSAAEAIAHLQRAGERAMRGFAPDRADLAFTRALDLMALERSDDDRARFELLFFAGQARLDDGRALDAAPLFRWAMELADANGWDERFASAVVNYVEALGIAHMPSDAADLLARAVAVSRAQPLLQKEVLYLLHLADDDRGARAERDAVARSRAEASPSDQAALLDGLWWWHFGERRVELADDLCALGRDVGDAGTLGAGLVRKWVAEFEVGRASFDEPVAAEIETALAHAPSDVRWFWQLWCTLVALYGRTDIHLARARLAETRGFDVFEPLPEAPIHRDYRRELAHQLIEAVILEFQGDAAAASTLFESVLSKSWWHAIDSRAMWALQLARRQRTTDAERICAELRAEGVTSRAPNPDWLVHVVHLADTYAVLGDADSAAAMLPVLEPYAGRHVLLGLVQYFGCVRHHLGLLHLTLGDVDRAIASLEQALDEHRRAASSVLTIRTRHQLAQAHEARGTPHDREAAEGLVAQATAEAARHGLSTHSALWLSSHIRTAGPARP